MQSANDGLVPYQSPASVGFMRGLCASWSPIALLAVFAAGCPASDEPDPTMMTTGIPLGTTGTMGPDESGAGDDTLGKLDVEAATGMAPCAEGGDDCLDMCEPSQHEPCDQGADDMIAALGLNCPGDAQVTVTTSGNPAAMSVRTGFGPTAEWAPREGSAFAVLGSGFTTDLDMETPPLDPDIGPTHCNDDLGDYDPGIGLPAPLRVNDVLGDCEADPTLLGTGDCSNTIQEQFDQGMEAFDYTELRIEATVPNTNNSLSYDFAFFSTEYPWYFGMEFNDMYVGWLESESWTGNISFDGSGNPISLNAGFLDFRDDGATLPEFDGTCMKQHAGTTWLNTTAPVTPGENITLVLAIFDLADSILDSYVFLDNFGWGCDGEDGPVTNPVG